MPTNGKTARTSSASSSAEPATHCPRLRPQHALRSQPARLTLQPTRQTPSATAAISGGGGASAGSIETDALVIGAGPVGLFQVFQLGLQDLRCHVVDVLSQPGGQCAELYPAKPIYDIPALPVCSGTELVERLLQQVAPFDPVLHLGQEVESLAPRADGRFDIGTSAGTQFIARAVFIAAGVGAFSPRRLKLPGLDTLAASCVSHQAPDVSACQGQTVLVHGGDDRALDWACRLAEHGVAVSLLYRRDVYPAAPEQVRRLELLASQGRVTRRVGQPTQARADAAGQLTGVDHLDPSGQTHHEPATRLFVSLGLSPRLGPLSSWGLQMERKLLDVEPSRFETSLPGVYAVGDINSYPGKLKLIVCGFHEATLAAWAAAHRLRPDAPHHLEYTTSSARLQRLLGVLPRGAQ